MFELSREGVIRLAALIWYGGSGVLLVKSSGLLLAAEGLNPGQPWVWLAIIAGLLLGGVKARYLFSGFCRKNILRINALQGRRPWHCYRGRFYLFLLTMVLLGGWCARLAEGDYGLLLLLALVELSVATALLAGGRCFWRGWPG